MQGKETAMITKETNNWELQLTLILVVLASVILKSQNRYRGPNFLGFTIAIGKDRVHGNYL